MNTVQNPADESAIRTLYQRMIDSWDRNDAHAYAANFTEDSDYIAFDGSHWRGRKANADNHDDLFRTFLKGSRLSGVIKDLQFLSPEIAVMHGEGAVLLRGQTQIQPSRRSIQTYVLVKRNGDWQVAAFHNTRIRPISAFAKALFRLMQKLTGNG